MKKKNKKHSFRNSPIFLVLIVIATIFLGIGYAQVANIELKVSGTATIESSEGIVISDISYFNSLKSAFNSLLAILFVEEIATLVPAR